MNREKPSDTVQGFTHKIECTEAGKDNFDIYVTVNFFNDTKRPCQIFVKIGKLSSELSIATNTMFEFVALHLQAGLPIYQIAQRIAYRRGDTVIYTDDPDIRHADSTMDLIGKWLLKQVEKGVIE